ncbi:hypothetical protein ACEWK1_23220 [Metabacillus sp. YM-086]|uniref:hypothetical protein n=1 Tax=Metabacillus sp. YM-086 TaxID=3341729 RepID=UPI003A8A02A8
MFADWMNDKRLVGRAGSVVRKGMNDKRLVERAGGVVHKGDERQKVGGKSGQCRS